LSVNGRRTPAKTHLLFDELVEDGRLERACVESWKQPAFLVPGVRMPRSVDARAIVSPFDPLLWERKWTKAVFDFDYQIEIYVPGPKRIFGYYVLPFLMEDRFAARGRSQGGQEGVHADRTRRMSKPGSIPVWSRKRSPPSCGRWRRGCRSSRSRSDRKATLQSR
jgi:uncharacterized protein YcaQ